VRVVEKYSTTDEEVVRAAEEKLGVGPREIAHWGKAVARWSRAGFPVRSGPIVAWIEGHCCRRCSYYRDGRCARCGCRVNVSRVPLTNKIKMATETCPNGRWPSEETVELYLSGGLKMPETQQPVPLQPVPLPIEPGLYWAKARLPQRLGPGTMMRGPGGQIVQPPPTTDEWPPEDWNAIITVWRGPSFSHATAYLFSETVPRMFTIPPGTLVEVGERIVQPGG